MSSTDESFPIEFDGFRRLLRTTNFLYAGKDRHPSVNSPLSETFKDGTVFGASVRPIYHPAHTYSSEEQERMKAYESIDFWHPASTLYQQELHKRGMHNKRMPMVIKAGLFLFIGFMVSLWAILLFHSVEHVGTWRLQLLHTCYESFGSWAMFLLFILWNSLFAFVSTLLCLLVPAAAGSGVPAVLSYLNGFIATEFFHVRVLLVKTLSSFCAVSSGLPVGAEGPMIQIGALLGGIVGGGGRSESGRSFQSGVFQTALQLRDFITVGAATGFTAVFGCPFGAVLFVTEEIASYMSHKLMGMTLASCTVCYLFVQFMGGIFNGWHLRDRLDATSPFWVASSSSTPLYSMVMDVHQLVPKSLLHVLAAIIVGLGSALLACGYIVTHLHITKWRHSCKQFLSPNLWILCRVMEPVLLTMLLSSLWFGLVFALPCQTVETTNRTDLKELILVQFVCENPSTQYSPLGSLVFTNTNNLIKLLWSRHARDLMPWYCLLPFLILYGSGAVYAMGLHLSTGVLIPTIVIGAAFGRLLLLFTQSSQLAEPGLMAFLGTAGFFAGLSRLTISICMVLVELSGDLEHVIPLVVVISVSRFVSDFFTHSLYHEQMAHLGMPFLDYDLHVHKLDCFTARDIMTPSPHQLPLVVTVAQLMDVAKSSHHSFPVVHRLDSDERFVGMMSQRSVRRLFWYIHEQLKQQQSLQTRDNIAPGYETLPTAFNPLTQSFREDDPRHQLLSPLLSLEPEELTPFSAQHSEVLKRSKRSPAPTSRHGISSKTVASPKTAPDTTEQLHSTTNSQVNAWRIELPTFAELESARYGESSCPSHLPMEVMSLSIDLSPFVDHSAWFVLGTSPVSHVYETFRSMYLRHLTVVDEFNNVLGMLTRKDLLGHFLFKNCVKAVLEENNIHYKNWFKRKFVGG